MKNNTKRTFAARFAAIALAALFCLSAAACAKPKGGDPAGDGGESISLSQTAIELLIDQSVTLTATASPADAAVEWTVGNPAVATVSGGTVTGVGTGSTTVTASIGDYTKAACSVVVRQDANAQYSVALNREETALFIGQTLTLSATVKLGSQTVPGAQVEWESSAPGIVSVGGDGRVAALAYGGAVVTAAYTPTDGKPAARADCAVSSLEFYDVRPNGLNGQKAVLPGASFSLADSLAVYDANGQAVPFDPGDVAWGSTDGTVVNFGGGQFTALKQGQAEAYAIYRGVSGYCAVSVFGIAAEDFAVYQDGGGSLSHGILEDLTDVAIGDAVYPNVIRATNNLNLYQPLIRIKSESLDRFRAYGVTEFTLSAYSASAAVLNGSFKYKQTGRDEYPQSGQAWLHTVTVPLADLEWIGFWQTDASGTPPLYIVVELG
ncbi:MAG: Ig-like domain-containing protein [Clostridiales bacterium]|jgi:hypothetical protein|nr:Ig-like domain-containing protein [Clostridiales bacterium]